MTKVVLRKGESVEKALRILKKKMSKEGVIKAIKRHRYYEKPSDKRRRIKKTSRRKNGSVMRF